MDDIKLIDKRGKGNTVLQVLGFLLILFGIIYLIIFLIFKIDELTSSKLSIVFFVIMMGVALAFPDLLRDQNHGLSTMRLVVFMMINVICILMLQIGWGKGSFDAIGINSYWMGIIAFVFGAKATQSYFESKLAVPPAILPQLSPPGVPPSSPVSPAATNSADLVRATIQQNQDLLTRFPAIVSMLLGSMPANGQNIYCVAIHVKGGNVSGIPSQLAVDFNGSRSSVPVNIISNLGNAQSNGTSGDSIVNKGTSNGPGTLGCFLTDSTNNLYALSCAHVMSDDQWGNYQGYNVPAGLTLYDNKTGEDLGNWAFALMNSSFDIAYTNVTNASVGRSAAMKTPRDVNDTDILHQTPVAFKGAVTNNGSAYICYNQCSRSIDYANGSYPLNNLILIGNNLGTSPAHAGDSGALVYTSGLIEPIGIIVGSDAQFTYLIPITSVLIITGKTIY